MGPTGRQPLVVVCTAIAALKLRIFGKRPIDRLEAPVVASTIGRYQGVTCFASLGLSR